MTEGVAKLNNKCQASSPWLPPGALIASTGGSQSPVRKRRVYLIRTAKPSFCDTLDNERATWNVEHGTW